MSRIHPDDPGKFDIRGISDPATDELGMITAPIKSIPVVSGWAAADSCSLSRVQGSPQRSGGDKYFNHGGHGEHGILQFLASVISAPSVVNRISPYPD
jgi:hypothetical protein